MNRDMFWDAAGHCAMARIIIDSIANDLVHISKNGPEVGARDVLNRLELVKHDIERLKATVTTVEAKMAEATRNGSDR